MIRMHSVVAILVTAGVAVGWAEDTNFKEVVDKAWTGSQAEKLKQVKAWSMTQECARSPTRQMEEGPFEGAFTITTHVQMPDRVWTEVVSTRKDGKKETELVVVNGNRGWRKKDGAVTALHDREVGDILQLARYGGIRLVLTLNDPGFRLTRLADGTAGGRSWVIHSVPTDGWHDNVIHIDPKTGRVVMLDDNTQFGRFETWFTDVRNVGGVPVAHAQTTWRKNEIVEERKHSVQFKDKHDPKLFEKP